MRLRLKRLFYLRPQDLGLPRMGPAGSHPRPSISQQWLILMMMMMTSSQMLTPSGATDFATWQLHSLQSVKSVCVGSKEPRLCLLTYALCRKGIKKQPVPGTVLDLKHLLMFRRAKEKRERLRSAHVAPEYIPLASGLTSKDAKAKDTASGILCTAAENHC